MADSDDEIPEDMLEALMDKQEEQMLAIYILLTNEERREEAVDSVRNTICAMAMCMGLSPEAAFEIFNRCKKKGFLE